MAGQVWPGSGQKKRKRLNEPCLVVMGLGLGPNKKNTNKNKNKNKTKTKTKNKNKTKKINTGKYDIKSNKTTLEYENI